MTPAKVLCGSDARIKELLRESATRLLEAGAVGDVSIYSVAGEVNIFSKYLTENVCMRISGFLLLPGSSLEQALFHSNAIDVRVLL